MNRQCLLEFQNKHKMIFTILNYCVFVLLSVFIFCTPFPYTTAITNISFYLAILIALFLIIFNPGAFTFKTPLTYPLTFFFLWSLASILWALDVENTVNDVRGHLFNYIIFYFLLINFFHSRKRLETLAWIIVLSATFFSLLGMVYYYVILSNPVDAIRLGGLTSTMGNVSTELPVNMIGALNITASLFCICFFSRAFFLYQRVIIGLCVMMSFVAIFLTQSRGTVVALVIAVIALLVSIRKKKFIFLFLVVICMLIILTPFKHRLDSASFYERMKINYVTYEVWKDYSLNGIGFGMMTFSNNINKNVYINKLPEKYRPVDIFTPHNWLLDIAVRLGLIGLALFSGILLVFIKMCWKTVKNARDEDIRNWGIYVTVAFLAYFVMGLVEPLFLFTASALIFYILLAMITILSRLNNEAQDVEVLPVDKQ